MIDQERPIYSDVGMFTRGRSGYRPDPHVPERRDAAWALIGFGVILAVFVAVHLAMPSVH